MEPAIRPEKLSPKQRRPCVALSFSSGIRKLRNIASFLDVDEVCSPSDAHHRRCELVAVLVWGRKNNSFRAIRYAQRHSLPVWFLEDGFIRSCESNSHSRKTYSLIVDKSGVYYDSHNISDMESLLNLPDMAFDELCGEESLAEAYACRTLMIQENITKYNYCKTAELSGYTSNPEKDLVLVIDQTLNDVSVTLGGMTPELFRQMLDAALTENPAANVVVRTHPDVVAGLRDGYLLEYAHERGVQLSADADNPIAWLKCATRVYAGTSQLGYEALLCGCEVTTFGQAFYTGWGLTDDRNPVQRRVQRRSLDQLFFVSHMMMSRYRNPVNGDVWTLRDCLEHVMEQKRQFSRNAFSFICVGITAWKRQYLKRYLRSPDGCVSFRSSLASLKAGEQALTWGYRRWQSSSDIRVARVEDGFLRSSGLGSDFIAPASLVVDRQGLYFDRHHPSDLENLLNHQLVTNDQRLRAGKLRKSIVTAGLSKYNVPGLSKAVVNNSTEPDCGKPVILIIGQVEDDESIRRGCAHINTNTALCQAVRAKRPDDYLVYKPHPDVESGNRKGAVDALVLSTCIDEVARQTSITEELSRSEECHTMTSLTGFEALLRGIPVFTYGMPFYAGWGLTHDEITCERRSCARRLDELVYLALIEYPRYLHVDSGEFLSAEAQVRFLVQEQSTEAAGDNTLRWVKKAGNIVKSLRYAA